MNHPKTQSGAVAREVERPPVCRKRPGRRCGERALALSLGVQTPPAVATCVQAGLRARRRNWPGLGLLQAGHPVRTPQTHGRGSPEWGLVDIVHRGGEGPGPTDGDSPQRLPCAHDPISGPAPPPRQAVCSADHAGPVASREVPLSLCTPDALGVNDPTPAARASTVQGALCSRRRQCLSLKNTKNVPEPWLPAKPFPSVLCLPLGSCDPHRSPGAWHGGEPRPWAAGQGGGHSSRPHLAQECTETAPDNQLVPGAALAALPGRRRPPASAPSPGPLSAPSSVQQPVGKASRCQAPRAVWA
ncbi:uncharacterized protein [Dipodomys merriami]|uniref:uncharacterized protein n=1 Tax=Dipodomys merriami TaxID=94247 RepID=UPI0038558692